MKKRLNSQSLVDELKVGSVFFQRPTPPSPPPVTASTEDNVSEPASPSDVVHSDETPNASSLPDTTVSRYHDTLPDTVIPQHDDTASDTTGSPPSPVDPALERVRRAIRQQGKEAATHRFTVDEKRMLKKIEHEYSLRGIRTSENEITRIAINYLCDDYKKNKEHSVLARILELLNK